MTTPTNHTTTSLFDFGDMLEPEPSQSSLEQNSSIAESNIFVSVGGEVSNHMRSNSSALNRSGDLKLEDSHPVETNNDVHVRPLQEESEAAGKLEIVTTTTEPKNSGGKGILKPSSYLESQREQNSEQQPKLTIDSEPRMVIGDSMPLGTGFSGSQQPSQPFSPTVHTSNQTSQFSKFHPPQAFSPTVHTSNQTPGFGINIPRDKHNSIDKIGMDNLQINKPDFDQSAERATAWAIHIALIFFCALIITCVLLAFRATDNYGFVTLVLMTFVIVFCAFLACFVDSTILSQNPKLRPVRQKILTAVRVTRRILENEYHLFIQDWKETLLITQGGESCSKNTTENLMGDDANNSSGMLQISTRQTRRKRSKVFKLIRPFLGLKKNLFRGKGRRQKTKSATVSDINCNGSPSDPVASYEAPAI